MSMALLRRTVSYTIEYDEDIEAVVHIWEEFTSGQAFREGCEALLTCIEERDAYKTLVDTRAIEAHDEEDRKWMREEWTPRVSEAGAEYTATVRSDSVIAEMDMENVTSHLDGSDHEMLVTADVGEARTWLAER